MTNPAPDASAPYPPGPGTPDPGASVPPPPPPPGPAAPPAYGTPSGDPSAPAYGTSAPAYGSSSVPAAGTSSAPAYGSPPGAYGSTPAAYGSTPGAYGAPTAGYGAPGPYPYAPPARRTNAMAIAAFVTGLLGFALIPVVLGHVALRQIRGTGESGGWMAVIGLVLGYGMCALYLLLIVLGGAIFVGSSS